MNVYIFDILKCIFDESFAPADPKQFKTKINKNKTEQWSFCSFIFLRGGVHRIKKKKIQLRNMIKLPLLFAMWMYNQIQFIYFLMTSFCVWIQVFHINRSTFWMLDNLRFVLNWKPRTYDNLDHTSVLTWDNEPQRKHIHETCCKLPSNDRGITESHPSTSHS